MRNDIQEVYFVMWEERFAGDIDPKPKKRQTTKAQWYNFHVNRKIISKYFESSHEFAKFYDECLSLWNQKMYIKKVRGVI